jgi:hypothetical protein
MGYLESVVVGDTIGSEEVDEIGRLEREVKDYLTHIELELYSNVHVDMLEVE